MVSIKFMKEYEVKASPKILFPYVSTASGLQEWFADKAVWDGNLQKFNFVWDNNDHWAKMVLHKLNKQVRFEFEQESGSVNDLAFIEFKLDTNELTQMVFLKITDYTPSATLVELEEIWDGLVFTLKEKIGG